MGEFSLKGEGMKRLMFIVFLVILITKSIFAQQILELSNKVDFAKKLNAHNIFFKHLIDFDIDDNGNYYFLDKIFGHILKVRPDTGALLKQISRKGQGPSELDQPTSLRIKNNKIYVFDKGFGGVKIFSLEGEFLGNIKTKSTSMDIEVSNKNEIYVRKINTDNSTLITVLDEEGNEVKHLVKCDLKNKKNKFEYHKNTSVRFSLDNKENLIVLFFLKRKLKKYGKERDLIWERDIDNELIKPWIKIKHKEVFLRRGMIHYSPIVFHLDVNLKDDILVGQAKGGAVYDKEGNLVSLIKDKDPMFLFKWNDNKIMEILLFGDIINIYDLTKGKK